MGAVTSPLLFFHDCEKCHYGGLSRDARESRVYVVEGGFPHISV